MPTTPCNFFFEQQENSGFCHNMYAETLFKSKGNGTKKVVSAGVFELSEFDLQRFYCTYTLLVLIFAGLKISLFLQF